MKKKFFLYLFIFISSIGFSQSWVQKANLPAGGRIASITFSIGNKGYLGTGRQGWGAFYADFWEYDPTANSWTQKANFGGGPRAYAVGYGLGSKGYLSTGYNGTLYFNDMWEYDPATNLWTQLASFAGVARGLDAGFEVGGKIYIGTGQKATAGALADLWEYTPGANTWTAKANFPGIARQDIDQASFTIGNLSYWGTGFDGWNVYDDFWQYNPGANTWTQKANFPGVKRFGSVGFTICGKGYVGQGEDYPAYKDYADFFMYDPVLNSWSPVPSCPGVPRCDARAFVINNKAYLGTGSNFAAGSFLTDWWEFTPVGVGSLSITATSSVICTGTAVTLNVSGGSTYLWSTGSTGSSIIVTPNTSTTYSVTDPGNACSSAGTIVVSVISQPPVSISGATSICAGGSTVLTATGGGNYAWTTGATTASIVVAPTVTTTYSVIASAATCADTGSFIVYVLPPLLASITCVDTVCFGQSAVLSAGGGGTYLWNTGATTQTIAPVPTASTSYSVVVSSGVCSDTVNCSVFVKPGPNANAGSDITIGSGASTTLIGSGGGTYLWSNGSDSASTVVSPAGTTGYVVTVTDASGCTDADTVLVFVEQIDCSLSSMGELFIPNAFSPNGDNENDRFQLLYGNYDCIETYNFIVYNRWGEKVFEADHPALSWDGMYNGNEENNAVFAWYMMVVLKDGTKIERKGNISLFR